MSIFETPAPPRATPSNGQAHGVLTGRKDPPPTQQRGPSVRNLPNKEQR